MTDMLCSCPQEYSLLLNIVSVSGLSKNNNFYLNQGLYKWDALRVIKVGFLHLQMLLVYILPNR